MSYYTTGDIAEQYDVSVRTIQYYDKKGILKPSHFTKTKRRIYTDDDLKKLELILLLKNMGCSLNEIKTLMNEESTMKTLNYILNMKEETLIKQIEQKQSIVDKIKLTKQYFNESSVTPIFKLNDIEKIVKESNNMKETYKKIILSASIVGIIQYTGLISSFVLRNKTPLFIVSPFIISYAIEITRYYYKNVEFICPNFQNQFRPSLNKVITAKHTMKTRRLECPNCHETNYCIETPAKTK
ncbi:DNA-binding transcriptional MerR regulator [Staphylococcus pasteuri]|uniref:MerR family transcriptional regulator n=1 Tax=Staphylococcus pasteuri_A TaxID=3062664 RepID=A0AAW7YN13_9STAP|nr:MerR family transcriptional regulator [Staphylococcus pasteuri_A]MDO6572668.1 MerR family transcriptional regulator [Staphylococcus pasteuri_A]